MSQKIKIKIKQKNYGNSYRKGEKRNKRLKNRSTKKLQKISKNNFFNAICSTNSKKIWKRVFFS